MRYENIPNGFYIEKRKKYNEQILPNSISIFASNDPLPSNADGTFGFIQNSTFFYLTGIDQADSFLILDNRTSPQTEILFVTETNEKIKIWEGEKLSKNLATDLSGVETVIWSDEFWKILEQYLNNCQNVYFSIDADQGKGSSFTSKNRQISKQIKRKFPNKNFINSAKITNNLRVIKSAEEIIQIKKAIEITKFGFERAARNLKPEMFEFELEAEITYEFQRRRSRMHAFQPIMAAGKNACILHYISNNELCKNGEMVLMDFGAEYGNYKADMTRVLPVNGKFTDRQAEIYTSVLDVMKAIKSQMVVGNTIVNLKKETQNLIGKELVKLKILTESDLKFNPKAIIKYFPHGVSHFLGIDVHDVGDRKKKLEAGMLLTLEPGIYIEHEAIGIRLENNILVKEAGNEDLMEDIPIEISEIEKSMQG
jgi:Xaa-Pro aminopeptidase